MVVRGPATDIHGEGFAPLPDHLYASLGGNKQFCFGPLALKDMDNKGVLEMNDPAMAGEETCLFHEDFSCGDDYFTMLHQTLAVAVAERRELPVVRFADGEYAFYGRRLDCNGLYRQAESRKAIKRAMPCHLEALRRLSRVGLLAPLVFPGNAVRNRARLTSLLPWWKEKTNAAGFLTFLNENDISLKSDNYLPFYVVYAYLTSGAFARLAHGRKVCILNSDYDAESCRRWFNRFDSSPRLVYREIPAAYLATRWDRVREDVLAQIPEDVEICLVGAGVGALTVCVDLAERFAVPALDAGHVLNMMNGREDKSKGPRLYTLRIGE